MTRARKDNLLNELTAAGASSSEASALLRVVDQLGAAPDTKRSRVVSAQVLESILASPRSKPWFGWLNRPARITALATIGVLVIGPLAAAQAALPGQPLYPLKRASETVVTTVVPSLQSTLAVRRSEEVKQLITNDEHRDQVEPTLHSIQSDVSTRPESARQQTTDKTKNNLEQAKQRATAPEQQAIEQTIESIDTTVRGDHSESPSGANRDGGSSTPEQPHGSTPVQPAPLPAATHPAATVPSVSAHGQSQTQRQDDAGRSSVDAQ